MVETNTKEIQNFKKILEYFVAHLEWLVDKNDQSIAYLKYIKPWIEDENFVSVGQGYDDGRIQRQIADWD